MADKVLAADEETLRRIVRSVLYTERISRRIEAWPRFHTRRHGGFTTTGTGTAAGVESSIGVCLSSPGDYSDHAGTAQGRSFFVDGNLGKALTLLPNGEGGALDIPPPDFFFSDGTVAIASGVVTLSGATFPAWVDEPAVPGAPTVRFFCEDARTGVGTGTGTGNPLMSSYTTVSARNSDTEIELDDATLDVDSGADYSVWIEQYEVEFISPGKWGYPQQDDLVILLGPLANINEEDAAMFVGWNLEAWAQLMSGYGWLDSSPQIPYHDPNEADPLHPRWGGLEC